MTAEQNVIPVIVGPTAVGKTEISVRVAERIDAEIVSSDSRQIFRQMRIGTAVPDDRTLARVPHHLISELDIGDEYSAGIFARMARERIADIQERGKRVIITGGSTLYLKALTEGLDDIPDVDPAIRKSLVKRMQTEGADRLYGELRDADPEYAATLDRTKTQRIVRGLEVYLGTGQPISDYYNIVSNKRLVYDITVFTRMRDVLYNRINTRVDDMASRGLFDEVRDVYEYARSRQVEIPPTIGYRELAPALAGDRSVTEGIRLMKRNSRRYAKRQLTWFRGLDDATWYDLGSMQADDVIDQIVERSADP